MNKLKVNYIELLRCYVDAGTYVLAATMVYLFMKAYTTGYQTMIKINVFNEAKIEAIMLILWLIGLVVLHWIDMYKNKVKIKEIKPIKWNYF